MEEMEQGKRYSAEDKGYTSKIYEIRWIPVSQRPEYQEEPVKGCLAKLQTLMSDKDFDKYIENNVIRITYDTGRLMLIARSEMGRTMLTGRFFNAICEAFDVGSFRVVSQVNGY